MAKRERGTTAKKAFESAMRNLGFSLRDLTIAQQMDEPVVRAAYLDSARRFLAQASRALDRMPKSDKK